jgi:hypothetical protein
MPISAPSIKALAIAHQLRSLLAGELTRDDWFDTEQQAMLRNSGGASAVPQSGGLLRQGDDLQHSRTESPPTLNANPMPWVT